MELTPALENRLRELTRVFLAENEKLNLSALRTEDACWHGNVLDSLAMADIMSKMGTEMPKTLMDVGTGGGFPLLPLAVIYPEMRCVGLDSIGKKMAAVGRIATAMNLQNVSVVAARAEEAGHKAEHRERYDLATSRAVAPIRMLLEYVSPFVKPGGTIVLWKSMHAEDEIRESQAAQRLLGCPLQEAHRYALPGDWGERQLLVFRKEKPLSKEFPREVGMAKKKPL